MKSVNVIIYLKEDLKQMIALFNKYNKPYKITDRSYGSSYYIIHVVIEEPQASYLKDDSLSFDESYGTVYVSDLESILLLDSI